MTVGGRVMGHERDAHVSRSMLIPKAHVVPTSPSETCAPSSFLPLVETFALLSFRPRPRAGTSFGIAQAARTGPG